MATEYHFTDANGNLFAAVGTSQSNAKKQLQRSYPGAALRFTGKEETNQAQFHLRDKEQSSDVIAKMLKAATPVRRVRRNEKCPCGSGRKVKHCCGAATKPT